MPMTIGDRTHLVRALGMVKLAAALANRDIGLPTPITADAIVSGSVPHR